MKKIKFILISFILLFSFNVNAASYGVSVTSKSVTVGNTISVTIKATGISGKVNLAVSNSNLALATTSLWVENNTQTVKVTAKKVGTCKITVTPADLSDSSTGKALSYGINTFSITINEKAVVTPKVKSSNNKLKSLGVSGYKIEPTFSADVLEYNVTLPVNTEKAKILATLADSSAKVSGTGEVSVSDGNNNFDIVVTAENGSTKTYKLNIYVTPLDQIIINVNDKEYSLVQRSKDMKELNEYYTLSEVTINEKSIPCYTNETLNYNIVCLKDSDGNIEFYKYENGNYTLYKDYTFNGITVEILDKEVDNYTKTKFNYSDSEIIGYQENKTDIYTNESKLGDVIESNYYLFYAVNLLTGKTNLYQYDKEENTIQIWNKNQVDNMKDTSNKYYLVILGLIGLILLIMIIFMIVLIKKNKRIKELKQEIIQKDDEVLFSDLEKKVKNKRKKNKKQDNNENVEKLD